MVYSKKLCETGRSQQKASEYLMVKIVFKNQAPAYRNQIFRFS